MRQLILDIRPDAPPDFDNFLPGPNAEAVSVLRDHAVGLIAEPLIFLWGESGTGKSHLLAAWADAAKAIPGRPLPEPPVNALAVDDVDSLDPDDQIRLFNLINAARERGGKVVVCGGSPPARLALRPDLATRLAQGLTYRLAPLSDADKSEALVIRAEARGMKLPDDVGRYLLTHCRRDLPHLLALVDALDTHSLSRKRPASLPLLKEILAEP